MDAARRLVVLSEIAGAPLREAILSGDLAACSAPGGRSRPGTASGSAAARPPLVPHTCARRGADPARAGRAARPRRSPRPFADALAPTLRGGVACSDGRPPRPLRGADPARASGSASSISTTPPRPARARRRQPARAHRAARAPPRRRLRRRDDALLDGYGRLARPGAARPLPGLTLLRLACIHGQPPSSSLSAHDRSGSAAAANRPRSRATLVQHRAPHVWWSADHDGSVPPE